MQQLSRPANLLLSFAAAAGTSLACLPRFLRWDERPATVAFLLLTACLTSFVLWAFVFAWSPRPGPAWLAPSPNYRDWLLALLAGILGAVLLHTTVDPTLRSLTPKDYPDSPAAWLAGTLFTLTFTQLFLCFAPFAFFHRLLSSTFFATLGTLAFGVLLLTLQLQATPIHASHGFILSLYSIRLLSGTVTLYLLLRGGPCLVWTSVLITQARLLPASLPT